MSDHGWNQLFLYMGTTGQVHSCFSRTATQLLTKQLHGFRTATRLLTEQLHGYSQNSYTATHRTATLLILQINCKAA